jgi:hypothetical protein
MSCRIEILPKENWAPPRIKENPLDITGNKGNKTLPAIANYRTETARISHNGTRADDPYLIELIRVYWIRPPPVGPYRFKSTRTDYSTHSQSLIIDRTLKNKVSITGEMIYGMVSPFFQGRCTVFVPLSICLSVCLLKTFMIVSSPIRFIG